MPQDNLKNARAVVDGWNAVFAGADALAWLQECCDPEVEWDLSRRGIDDEVYRGYDGLQRLLGHLREAWQEFRFERSELIDAGDSVAVFADSVGRGRSDIELEVRTGQVFTFRDGKLIRYCYFGEDRHACLSAAGLPTDA
ncbi:MAG: nuclear transport factor 2 family protein [Solirubrobacteraceae bacterium]